MSSLRFGAIQGAVGACNQGIDAFGCLILSDAEARGNGLANRVADSRSVCGQSNAVADSRQEECLAWQVHCPARPTLARSANMRHRFEPSASLAWMMTLPAATPVSSAIIEHLAFSREHAVPQP